MLNRLSAALPVALLLVVPVAPQAAPQLSIRDGFLFAQHLSLAHVRWQTGISSGAPQTAQVRALLPAGCQ